MKDADLNVNICMISDNDYVVPVSVALCSMRDSKSIYTNYNIYILHNMMNKSNIKKILSIAENNFNIEVINVASSLHDIERFVIDGIPATPTSICKFYIPGILKNLDKVLYLDGDIIVRKDLMALYNIEIEKDNYIAAVKDLNGLNKFGEKRGKYFKYFNSGVMLLDLKKMRRDNMTEKIMKYRINGVNKTMDQDALNYVFKDKVKFIPFKYNTQASVLMANLLNLKNHSIANISKYWGIENKSIMTVEDFLDDAVVFHYTWTKPWKCVDGIGNDLWLRYYYESPYRDMPLKLRSEYVKFIANSMPYKLGCAVMAPLKIIKSKIMSIKKDKYDKFLVTFIDNKHRSRFAEYCINFRGRFKEK